MHNYVDIFRFGYVLSILQYIIDIKMTKLKGIPSGYSMSVYTIYLEVGIII